MIRALSPYVGKRGEGLPFLVQAIIWVALLAIIGGLAYLFIVKGGSGSLPGENLLVP